MREVKGILDFWFLDIILETLWLNMQLCICPSNALQFDLYIENAMLNIMGLTNSIMVYELL